MISTTTASITRASRNDTRRRRRRSIAGALAAVALLYGGLVWAQGIETRAVRVEPTDEGWIAEADFSVDISPILREAVERGVPLYFIVEADVRRQRWYWLDEKIPVAPLTMRLSYNALVRQYRIQAGSEGLAQRFEDVEEAQRALGTVRSWRLGDRTLLQKNERYTVAVRMRLDVTQLPKPFQLTAITNRDWSLESGWARMSLQP